ncbi:F-box domain-containing protein [Podospora australis]|uniref:F-box domain-containing protein n=1 Tax=Podospora australis TaxID=1536484 RepID=A0AAN6WV41_9PEZI|nr:F-box domain-containing protein [Podospora australis]
MNSKTSLESLPNELLLSTLSDLPTRDLLPLVAVNHRFCSATLRILQQRLTRATSLPDHRVILECYHPAAKLSTPTLNCDYLYTDSFFSDDDKTPQETEVDITKTSLKQVYAHFKPVVRDENRRPRARYPPSSTSNAANPPQNWQRETKPTHDLYLDEDEPFSQLCAVTSVSKVGPKPGLYLSHVNLDDSVIRIKRDWLASQVGRRRGSADTPSIEDDNILWTDNTKEVGIRFRVTEIDVGAPVLLNSEEDPPVGYSLEFEELLVRASTLLMTVEKSEKQEIATEGKAIVIASI